MGLVLWQFVFVFCKGKITNLRGVTCVIFYGEEVFVDVLFLAFLTFGKINSGVVCSLLLKRLVMYLVFLFL